MKKSLQQNTMAIDSFLLQQNLSNYLKTNAKNFSVSESK